MRANYFNLLLITWQFTIIKSMTLFFSKNIMVASALFIFAFCGLYPADALGKLSAEAELAYVNYDAKDNTGSHLSAHSLTQRYSLLYHDQGKIIDGRLGKYNLSLGYDWSTFDTKISSTTGSDSPSASRGHIIYQGEVVIDPKEIPLRLTAYSRDMNRNAFSQDSSNLLGSLQGRGNSLLGSPQLATGIMNGIHIDSGATLVMGVKNGMTNGYNELLRHFPMLMLDYRDSINRDRNASFPVDNRFSRLAFVSLNKKDNWFHYRLLSYEDYINSDNNYKESQVQLGTIDHNMQRRWIDFSNWLMVSADGQLTKRMNATTADNYDEFDLNLFGYARRSAWEARSFNNFNRNKEENGRITYRTTVPVYVNGSLNADTSWSTRFSYNENHDNQNNQFTDISGGYRIDTFKRSPFTLSQQLDIEKASTNISELFIISGAVETTSTARFSRNVGLGATYNIRNYLSDTNSSSSNFLDQNISAYATYSPTNLTRMSLRQTNRITSGTSQYVSSTVEGANIGIQQYTNPRNNSYEGNGSTFQSITDFSISWNPLPRLNTSLSINEDIYIPQNDARSYKTNVVHRADYSGTNFKLTTNNTFTIDNTEPESNSYSLISENSAQYTFNRNLDSSIRISYYKGLSDLDESDNLSMSQTLNYNYYRTNGVTRKLFEIHETFEHTEGRTTTTVNNITTVSNKNRTSALSLGARYYPLRQLILAAGSKYSFFSTFSDYTLTYYASLGLNFRLFQASLDYAYGTARSDGRIEKRFTANFRKTF